MNNDSAKEIRLAKMREYYRKNKKRLIAKMAIYRREHLDKLRQYIKDYQKAHPRKATPHDLEKMREWKRKNPEKVKVRYLVWKAMRDGIIKKPESCEECGSKTRICAHHDDYSKPLQVRWLCWSCHKFFHSGVDSKIVV